MYYRFMLPTLNKVIIVIIIIIIMDILLSLLMLEKTFVFQFKDNVRETETGIDSSLTNVSLM